MSLWLHFECFEMETSNNSPLQDCLEEDTEGCIEIERFSLAQKLQSELHSTISDVQLSLELFP